MHIGKPVTSAGTEEPFRVNLTCVQVLEANHDPRSVQLLTRAHDKLLEQATRIKDTEMRRSYRQNVAVHREIVRRVNGVYSQLSVPN